MSKKSNKSSWALLQVDLIRYSQRKTQKDWILIFNLKELEQGIIKFFYANIFVLSVQLHELCQMVGNG